MSLEETKQELEQNWDEGHIDGYSFPWDVLPRYLKDFTGQVHKKLLEAIKRVVGALRWRGAILGPHNPIFGGSDIQWSFDGEQWYPLPSGGISMKIELGPSWTVHVFDSTRADIDALLADGVSEPLGHELLREAWAERDGNPRSALVIGVAALEVGFKEFVATLVPQAEWLVENLPNPPVVRMLREYLPLLPFRCRFEDRVLPPPQEILEIIHKGVILRNRTAHASGATLRSETIKEILLAVSDVLWLLDYYRGFEWAHEHIRDETKTKIQP